MTATGANPTGRIWFSRETLSSLGLGLETTTPVVICPPWVWAGDDLATVLGTLPEPPEPDPKSPQDMPPPANDDDEGEWPLAA